MNRRQKRQRQKQPLPKQAAGKSAELKKPRRPPNPVRDGNARQGSKLSRNATNQPIPAGSELKPVRTRSTPLSSLQKDNLRAGARASPKRKARRRRTRSKFPWLYVTRLLILGVGISALAGTILSVWEPPSSRHPAGASVTATSQVQQNRSASSQPLPTAGEIISLKAQIQAMAAKNPQLQPGVFILDLDTGAYLDLQATSTFSAASTIKLPILVAFFQDVDAGKIRLDEQLTMLPQLIVSGSGDMQNQKPGTQFTALETATKMITISDNTATNMLVKRLGGAEVLNQRFGSWGLMATAIRNPLPDLSGTNTTSPKDLASALAMVNRGELVSPRSRDLILDIMHRTVRNSLLPRGLGKGATIAHKTGDIGELIADVGLIDLPIGKRYIAAVMVKRPYNDPSAQDLIRQISGAAYQYFSPPATSPNSTESPPSTSAPAIGVFSAGNPRD